MSWSLLDAGNSPVVTLGADPLFPALNLNPMTATGSGGPETRQHHPRPGQRTLGSAPETLLPSCSGPLPGPADEGGCGAGQSHDPGEGDAHDGVVLPEAEVAHGLAHHHVPLDGQDHQGPQCDFTCKAAAVSQPTTWLDLSF